MKCSKCGQPVNQNDIFCTNCGEKINKEIMKNDKKTNKKLILIFLAEIILITTLALSISIYYNKHFNNTYATPDEFKEYINNKNYTLQDATQSYGNKNIKSYYFATNGKNLGIHYIVAHNNKNANNTFNNLYNQIKSKQSGFSSTVSINILNYNYYSLENNGNYYVVIKNNNTILAATDSQKYKSEINTIVKELGFEYSTSIFYIISAIAIFIIIIMYIVMWKIFSKAGKKGWYSLIPFYNCYCLSKITFNKGWLFIFILLTPINIVFIPLTYYKLAKQFSKSDAFAVCSIFFPYITMQIIAFDKSKYKKQK